jgi:hypothetical protein
MEPFVRSKIVNFPKGVQCSTTMLPHFSHPANFRCRQLVPNHAHSITIAIRGGTVLAASDAKDKYWSVRMR